MIGAKPDKVDPVVATQDGMVSRAQALAAGLSDGALRHRLRPGGPWSACLPGVYLTAGGTPTQAQREIAAILYGGPQCVLTGPAALRRLRLPAPDSADVDILIPAATRRQSVAYVTVHRTSRMPAMVFGPKNRPCASPARATADAVRGLADLRSARALLAGVVQAGGCSTDELADELGSGAIQYSALLRAVLAEVADGVRSAPEADLRALIQRARLPMPLFNARLYLPNGAFLAQPDAWWPEAGVAAEVDSKRWHLSPDDWERTMDRHARLSQHSIVTLHISPHKLRNDPASVIAAIRNAYRSGAARPRLPITTFPATPARVDVP
jgi:hypothetical protein